jgi:hypothetical protein
MVEATSVIKHFSPGAFLKILTTTKSQQKPETSHFADAAKAEQLLEIVVAFKMADTLTKLQPSRYQMVSASVNGVLEKPTCLPAVSKTVQKRSMDAVPRIKVSPGMGSPSCCTTR